MPYYIFYDEATRQVKRWVLCAPEMIRMQPINPGEAVAWIELAPPTLGQGPKKFFDPTTRKIVDDDTPADR